MKTKQLALDALKKCLDEFGPEHDGTDFESECTECWAAKQAREGVAALEADIAQPVEPVWFACDTEGAEFDITFVTTREEAAEAVDCALADDPDLKFEDLVTPLYTTQPEPAVNAELLEALKRCKFDSLNMSLADMEFCRAAFLKATS
jgi:hypothetical protein